MDSINIVKELPGAVSLRAAQRAIVIGAAITETGRPALQAPTPERSAEEKPARWGGEFWFKPPQREWGINE